MSNSITLYRTIIDMILDTRTHFHDIRCLVTFAWAIRWDADGEKRVRE